MIRKVNDFFHINRNFAADSAMKLLSSVNKVFSARVFLWVYPFLMIVPNVVLDITEYSPPLVKITNILLPLGIYIFVMSLWKNVGRTSLFFIPLLVYTCVQLVLLHLYGESIIAVDMLLNLVTTNASEASELLGNLALAIFLTGIVYIPLLIWGLVLAVCRVNCQESWLRPARITGELLMGLGLVTMCLSYGLHRNFRLTRDIFPFNVVTNTVIATQRTIDTRNYYHTSSGFSYYAQPSRDAALREIYVMVVGETSRADNWQIFGYDRPTNPRLSQRDDLLVYPKTLTESNITHKSVPLMLSWTTASNFGDSVFTSKSVIDAFNEAGYRTAFLSNQGRNHSFIDFFAREAQTGIFLPDDGAHHYDIELAAELERIIATSPSNKIFAVLHTYGSHYNYRERYPEKDAVFLPDEHTVPEIANRSQMINAYDNSLLQTDLLLARVIDILGSQNCAAAMIYVSDHGEDILDDPRERYLHASPVPTYYQLHVPLVMWMSPGYRELYPGICSAGASHCADDVSSSRIVFHTLLGLAGITSPYLVPEKSLVSDRYVPGPRCFLNDLNEGVSLEAAGLRDYDFARLREKGISEK